MILTSFYGGNCNPLDTLSPWVLRALEYHSPKIFLPGKWSQNLLPRTIFTSEKEIKSLNVFFLLDLFKLNIIKK